MPNRQPARTRWNTHNQTHLLTKIHQDTNAHQGQRHTHACVRVASDNHASIHEASVSRTWLKAYGRPNTPAPTNEINTLANTFAAEYFPSPSLTAWAVIAAVTAATAAPCHKPGSQFTLPWFCSPSQATRLGHAANTGNQLSGRQG